jgi:hypothetical protein
MHPVCGDIIDKLILENRRERSGKQNREGL